MSTVSAAASQRCREVATRTTSHRDVMLLNIVTGQPQPESGYGYGMQLVFD